jgi:TolB-like protein/DNA-binding winged helix-turn-helix (wHTH) protein/Flp pilus assembly protein TadD
LATQFHTPQGAVRFGNFEFDDRTRELTENGRTLRLEPQPAKLLSVLIRNAGMVVTRQELIREIWGADTFVDFDQGLNYAIRRIRAALNDDADAPHYLETIPRTGYRFVAHVVPSARPDQSAEVFLSSQSKPEHPAVSSWGAAPKPPQGTRTRQWLTSWRIGALVVIPALLLAAITSAYKYRHHPAATPSSRPSSLAVLPLRNLSADPQQEYFSDGMTEQLITDLAKSSGVKVISHTSVERYKHSTKSLPQIARELGVDAVVEGTVSRAGDRVRITTQLIDARSDAHIWADSYERDLTDVLAIQDTLAREITMQIQGNITPDKASDLSDARNVPATAVDSYMRGRYLWAQRNPQSIGAARAYLDDAIHQAPRFAAAYSGLADAYAVAWGRADLPLAEKYAVKAVSLDPQLAEAHASLGIVLLFERRIREAEVELVRAIDLNPNYAIAHHYYSAFLFRQGRLEDALRENDRARQLDPFGLAVNAFRTVILIDSHRFNDALVQAANVAELLPQNPVGYGYMARIYWLQGRVSDAIESERKEGAARHMDEWVNVQSKLQEMYRKAGSRPTYTASAELMVKFKPFAAALQYGNLRKSEKVLELLKANMHNGDLVTEIHVAPEFDFLRRDSRFVEIERAIHPIE